MYAESPPASSSHTAPLLTPFQDYQRECQQQFYRVFPDARHHDSIWGPPQYTTTYDTMDTFGGPIFQYDSSLTSSGLDRGYTAVETGALPGRPSDLSSQYSTQPYYDSYTNTGLQQNQTELVTSHGQSGHYYSHASPDAVPYYPEQDNSTPSYPVPSHQHPSGYYTPEQQYPNVQSETPNTESSYVSSYNQHDYEQPYPNTENRTGVNFLDAQSSTRHDRYQSESTIGLESSSHTHFSEDIPEPIIPAPVQLADALLPIRKETQAPAPPSVTTRRKPSDALRSNETIKHESESLLSNNTSLSSRGAVGPHRLDHRLPRSISRIPSQTPNASNPSWLGPPLGPLLPSSRASMPLSPLPTKRQLEKKPPLACLFCRGRKIACGPPVPGSPDKTCNQCQRRSLPCEYPTESRRGMRKKKILDSVETANKDASTTSPSTDAD